MHTSSLVTEGDEEDGFGEGRVVVGLLRNEIQCNWCGMGCT